MQALHRKLDVVLVQILPYNCSETAQRFAKIRPRQYSDAGFTLRPFHPPLCFCSAVPGFTNVYFFYFGVMNKNDANSNGGIEYGISCNISS